MLQQHTQQDEDRTVKELPGTQAEPLKLSVVEQSLPSEKTAGKYDPTENFTRGRNEAIRKAKERAARRAAGESTPLERYRAGEYPCAEWSDEEISKGKPANIDGTFTGPMPRLTARQQAEIKRELLKRGQQRLEQYYFNALETLNDVATGGDSDAARVKAANILMERVAGKTPERIEIKSSDPWQDILDEVLNDEVLEPIEQTEDSQTGG